jgi:hypothetical protein
MKWWFLLAIPAIVLAHGHVKTAGLIYGGFVAVAYVISVIRHPRRVCRACGGTGRHRGMMFWWGDRACTTCGGSPRHRRWGAQVLYGGEGQRTWGEQAPKAAAKRRGAIR